MNRRTPHPTPCLAGLLTLYPVAPFAALVANLGTASRPAQAAGPRSLSLVTRDDLHRHLGSIDI